jgi:hypothetical protein
MRRLFMLVGMVTFAACASPAQLRDRSEEHAQLAQGAAWHGDSHRAHQQQVKAQQLYDRAAVRAWEEGQPVPPPPKTPPVYPDSVRQY